MNAFDRIIGYDAIKQELIRIADALTAARFCDEEARGFTLYRKNRKGRCLADAERRILISLAGRAATEIRFGQIDLGSSGDLDSVFDTILKLLGSRSGSGSPLSQGEEAAV